MYTKYSEVVSSELTMTTGAAEDKVNVNGFLRYSGESNELTEMSIPEFSY